MGTLEACEGEKQQKKKTQKEIEKDYNNSLIDEKRNNNKVLNLLFPQAFQM